MAGRAKVVDTVDGNGSCGAALVFAFPFPFFEVFALGFGRMDSAGVDTVRPRFDETAGSSSSQVRLVGTEGGDGFRGDIGGGWC